MIKHLVLGDITRSEWNNDFSLNVLRERNSQTFSLFQVGERKHTEQECGKGGGNAQAFLNENTLGCEKAHAGEGGAAERNLG